MATTAAGDAAITKPVIQLMKDVISKEDDRQILHTDLRSMDSLLEYIGIFFLNQQKEPPEIIKIWLQLLQNSLTEANGLFKRSGQRQSCLYCVVCNPRRLSKEIREWKAFFDHLYQGFLSDLCLHISTDAIISQVIDLVIELLKNVIKEQHNRPILPTDLRRMETLLQDITLLREDITTLFQPLKLLQKSISEAKGFLADPVVCGSWRLSKERREWSASFGKIYDGFQSDLPKLAIVTRSAGNTMIDPVVQLMAEIIKKEDNRQILQSDSLNRMDILLKDIVSMFRDQQEALPEIVKIWLQLLRNSLPEAESLLYIDRSGRRQRCVDCLLCRPSSLSKEIIEWNKLFDEIYHGFQSDLSILLTSLQFLSSNPLHNDEALLQEEAAAALVGSGIIDAQAQVEWWLNERDPRVHVIGVYGLPAVGKTSLLRMLYNKYRYQVSNPVFQEVIWVTVSEYYEIFDLQNAIQHQIRGHLFVSLRDSLDEKKMELSAYLKECKFLLVLDGLWSRLDLQEVGVAFGDNKHSKVLFSTRRKNLIAEMSADESTEIQPLSKEEGWMLYRRLAFKGDQVSMEIEDRARKIADQCRGRPLAIHVVAAAMIGQSSVEKYWDTCLSSIQNVDPSFPATDSRLDAELYAALRFSYDALPNSDVKKCFLYCALYEEEQEIDTLELVQMWIGEGLVKSKQGTYLMDMAVGRKYLQLLVDRRLFHTVKDPKDVFNKQKTIRVQSAIRDMAIYIGQKEEKCLFMASDKYQRNFSEVPDENCRRISLASNFNEDLPTQLRCPQLASLILKENRNLKELPSELLLSLTSLRVLNLSQISSVPTSIDKLRMLEFLSLSELPIEELPKEICCLSQLQYLDLSGCENLKSLPSEIGEIQNLKCLNLEGCRSLELIPREISELTSLSRLVLSWREEAARSLEAAAARIMEAARSMEAKAARSNEVARLMEPARLMEAAARRIEEATSMETQAAISMEAEAARSIEAARSMEEASMEAARAARSMEEASMEAEAEAARLMEAAARAARSMEEASMEASRLMEEEARAARSMEAARSLKAEGARLMEAATAIEEATSMETQAAISMEAARSMEAKAARIIEGARSMEAEAARVMARSLEAEAARSMEAEAAKLMKAAARNMEAAARSMEAARMEAARLKKAARIMEAEAARIMEAEAPSIKEAVRSMEAKAARVMARSLEEARSLEAEAKRVMARSLEGEAARSLRAEAARVMEAEAARNMEATRSMEAEAARVMEAERSLEAEAARSMEAEAASIWRLKGLKNMTELSVWIDWYAELKDGIMGTWAEMRHLMLIYRYYGSDEDMKSMKKLQSFMLYGELPEDMKSMKKLQSFMLRFYRGYHCLPNCCKFEHLEMVSLEWCWNIRELSPLEWMPNLKLLKLESCYGLRELGIGSRGGYQRLQKLVLKDLRYLERLGGASKTERAWDERTLPNLHVLKIIDCYSLKRFPTGMEKLPNLKLLKLSNCYELRELGIGSRGGYQRLQKLVLEYLWHLESLGGASNTEGVWDERTLPNLRVLKIIDCDFLKIFPTGMEKLPNLCTLMGSSEWWESIRWEDNSMKIKLQSIFKECNA